MWLACARAEEGLPAASPLATVLDAAEAGAPALRQLAGLREGRGGDRELPIDADLPPRLRFHTLITCPVSRAVIPPTTPPVLLSCGHVLSRGAMSELAAGRSAVKCPYCPHSTNLAQVLPLRLEG